MWPALISYSVGNTRQASRRTWCSETTAIRCRQGRLRCMPKARSQACAAALCCVQLQLPMLLVTLRACVVHLNCAGMRTSPVAACGKSCRRVGKTGNPLRPLHRQAGTRPTRSRRWPASIGKMPSALQPAASSTGRQPIACGVACAAIGKTAKVSEAQPHSIGKKPKSGAQASTSIGKKAKPCVQLWTSTGRKLKSAAPVLTRTGSSKVCLSALRMRLASARQSQLPWLSAITGRKPCGLCPASAASCPRLNTFAGRQACQRTCSLTRPGQPHCRRNWCSHAGAAHRRSLTHPSSCRRLGVTS